MNEESKPDVNESDLYETIEVKEESCQLVVIRISEEWYGIDMTRVREVIKIDRITYLPSALPHIVGIFSLRGNILPITDLRDLLGLTKEGLTPRSRLVIIKSGSLETALLCDEVSEPVEIPLSQIDPPLATISPEQAEYIEGQCKVDQKLIGILKVEKILGQQG